MNPEKLPNHHPGEKIREWNDGKFKYEEYAGGNPDNPDVRKYCLNCEGIVFGEDPKDCHSCQKKEERAEEKELNEMIKKEEQENSGETLEEPEKAA